MSQLALHCDNANLAGIFYVQELAISGLAVLATREFLRLGNIYRIKYVVIHDLAIS